MLTWEYSLQILLPPNTEEAFRQWTVQANTSWPEWGGHITVLQSFTARNPQTDARPILTPFIYEICMRHAPFRLEMDSITVDEYWGRPGQYAVMLVRDPDLAPNQHLQDLHEELVEALSPHIQYIYPAFAAKDFLPHVSLTQGMYLDEALVLADVARKSKLNLNFEVQQVTLMVRQRTADDTVRHFEKLKFRLMGG